MKNTRHGFTLIELLIVISIIAILAAIMIPGVINARRSTLVAGVATDITQLEAAIAQFKASFNIEPPSDILIYEVGSNWATYDTNGRSTAFMRQIWPQYDFGDHDINGDGSVADVKDKLTGNPGFHLRTGECLVFFLGGVNVTNIPGNIGASVGFSNNPTNPFDRGGSRTAPLFRFSQARFTDIDGDGWPEYRDNLSGQTMPYQYFSSYDGTGYSEGSEFATTTNVGITLAYRQSTNLGANNFFAPFGHQIISPGFDQKYGYGGAWIKGADPLPIGTTGTNVVVVSNGSSVTIESPVPGSRNDEADNITNFSSGTLSR